MHWIEQCLLRDLVQHAVFIGRGLSLFGIFDQKMERYYIAHPDTLTMIMQAPGQLQGTYPTKTTHNSIHKQLEVSHSVYHPAKIPTPAHPTHYIINHSAPTPPQIQPQRMHATVNSTTACMHHHKSNHSTCTSPGTKLQHMHLTGNATKAYSHTQHTPPNLYFT